jgi:hypothetical protein
MTLLAMATEGVVQLYYTTFFLASLIAIGMLIYSAKHHEKD